MASALPGAPAAAARAAASASAAAAAAATALAATSVASSAAKPSSEAAGVTTGRGTSGRGSTGPPSPEWKRLLHASVKKQRNQRTVKHVQIATSGIDGFPSVRTIVFRGFLNDSCRMIFYTDTRSAKVLETKANPRAEVCWYFPDTWEQYRVKGQTELVDASVASPEMLRLRERSWRGLSERQRRTWRGPTPGAPRDVTLGTPLGLDASGLGVPPTPEASRVPEPEAGVSNGGDHESQGVPAQQLAAVQGTPEDTPEGRSTSDSQDGGLQEAPLDCFCLLLFTPIQVDYLSIKKDVRCVHRIQSAEGKSHSDQEWLTQELNP